MRKQLELVLALATLILQALGVAAVTVLPSAKATYVEGVITQDTEWTLVDSPYVLSGNLLVLSNATLTIDPDVEVRFAEDFSLTVAGRMVAEGSEGHTIRFTSNKAEPAPGDWKTIDFAAASPSTISSLEYCIIEYGVNGSTVESGVLNMRNSSVQFNSEFGITATGGSCAIENSEICNNLVGGVHLAGNSSATIRYNVLRANGDGIILAGNTAAAATVEHNDICFNEQSGLRLNATSYSGTVILVNNVFQNYYGIYVSSVQPVQISREYVFNNEFGMFFAEGTGHEAHFNDIYNNTFGASVSGWSTANVTRNYWGHRSGPHHESLNPRGRGNPVGGDGVNLDFIFYLSAPIDYVNANPVAKLWTDHVTAPPGENVTFMGTQSSDDGRIDQYLFDFGDGQNSGWTSLSIFMHSYASVGNYTAKLKVIDDFGVSSSNATAKICVDNLAPLSVDMNLSEYVVDYNEQITVTVYVSDGAAGVPNATVAFFSTEGGMFGSPSGLTDEAGYVTVTFTAPNVTTLSNARIVARANVTGYADGCSYKYLTIFPPLAVQVTSLPATVKSEQNTTVTVTVTDGFEQLVGDVYLELSCSNGSLSTYAGVTNINGTMTFGFTAPHTLSSFSVTIACVATKSGFAEGRGQGTVFVEPKVLELELTSSPTEILSEATSTVTARVTSDSGPVSDVVVTASSGDVGSFAASTGITNQNGVASFTFMAPQVSAELSVSIAMVAAKNGYVSAAGQTVIAVMPKVLVVELNPSSSSTVSEAQVNISVVATYDGAPVRDANVTIASHNGGNFSLSSASTDGEGIAVFIFNAPQVTAPINVTLTAQAQKSGYANGSCFLSLVVSPAVFEIDVKAEPTTIVSRESTIVVVTVTRDGVYVSDALVTVSCGSGNFSGTTGFTDASGRCSFVFNAPRTTAQVPIVAVANVTKAGYLDGGNQTVIIVAPEVEAASEGGFPLVLLLLIVLPVVIAVVAVVLIKLKFISVSLKEET